MGVKHLSCFMSPLRLVAAAFSSSVVVSIFPAMATKGHFTEPRSIRSCVTKESKTASTPYKLAASSPPTSCARGNAHGRVYDCPDPARARRADARGPHRHLLRCFSTLATQGRPRFCAALGDAASGARAPRIAPTTLPRHSQFDMTQPSTL